jgi:hypothetical protein
MRSSTLICLGLLIIAFSHTAFAYNSDQTENEKNALLSAMQSAGVNSDDLALIQANINDLSVEQLTAINQFMTNPNVIADRHWFDVSRYSSWDDYNFQQPMGDKVLGILARRDLFLDPARELNNRTLTNMSPEALAALAFSQVYVEEKWDHEVPWDRDPNSTFNWIHPTLLSNPNIFLFLHGDFLYRERTTSWWATYWSTLMDIMYKLGSGQGSDMEAALQGMSFNAPRLAGYSYPLGNQLYLQSAETVYWYADYLKYGESRYGAFKVKELDTRIQFPKTPDDQWQYPLDITNCGSNSAFAQFPGLCGLFMAPFARQLRIELQQPETAAFWNVMRYVHAAARQHEGGASADHPENGQPPIMALQYDKRTVNPVGRKTKDISVFALITTVYSDSLLLDFTNWDSNHGALIQLPIDTSRTDGLNRSISERDKAIRVIEQMGDENHYSNATHIAGSRGLGFNLTTQYDNPINGDFLPYTGYEAHALVMALTIEARDYEVEDSRSTLCTSPLLRRGYDEYVKAAFADKQQSMVWADVVGNLCS